MIGWLLAPKSLVTCVPHGRDASCGLVGWYRAALIALCDVLNLSACLFSGPLDYDHEFLP